MPKRGPLRAAMLPRFQFVRSGASGCLNFTAPCSLFSLISFGSACLLRTELNRFLVLFCLREANGKTRAAIVTILSRESSPVRLDDAAGNRQSHSGSPRFCRKKWFEQLVDDSAGKARTRIAHAKQNFPLSIPIHANDEASRIRADNRHGFEGIQRQVEQHLQQLQPVCYYAPGFRIDLRSQGDLPRQRIRFYYPKQISDDFIDAHECTGRFLPAYHVANTLDYFSGTVPVRHDVGEQII